MAQRDLLKRYLEAGMAFTAMTTKRAEEIVKELVRAGEVQRDQVQNQVDELLERSRRNTDHLVALVRKEVSSQLNDLGATIRDELRALESRLTGNAGSTGTAGKAGNAGSTGTAGKAGNAASRQGPPRAAGGDAPAKKSPAKRAAAKKAPTTKSAPAPKAGSDGTVAAASASAVKDAAVTTKKAPAKRAPAKKAAVKKAPAETSPAPAKAPADASPAPKKAAAKKSAAKKATAPSDPGRS